MSNHKTNRLRKTACGKPAISANTACLMSWRKFAESTESIPNAPCFLMWAARLTTIVFTKPNISTVGSCTGGEQIVYFEIELAEDGSPPVAQWRDAAADFNFCRHNKGFGKGLGAILQEVWVEMNGTQAA